MRGTKTEPNYLKELRLAYRLSSVNIQIQAPPGSDPLSVVKFAIQQLNRDSDYNRAYCVFDRDQHTTFDQAVDRAQTSKFGKEGKLLVIPSVPCFEIWILLHYRFTTGAYSGAGGLTACERLTRDVRKHFATYEKGHKAVFTELTPMLDQALVNAARLEKHNSDTGSGNPATRMHNLVNYLRALKK
jgi:hypothetical protein